MQANDRRREQASRVSASVVSVGLQDDRLLTIDVKVSNQSDRPIYEVSPVLARADPGATLRSETRRIIAGGESVELSTPDCSPTVPPVGVAFRDSAGRWWTRRVDGVLVDRTFSVRLIRWSHRHEPDARPGIAHRVVGRIIRKVLFLYGAPVEPLERSKEPASWSATTVVAATVAVVAVALMEWVAAPGFAVLMRFLGSKLGVSLLLAVVAGVAASTAVRSRREDRAAAAFERRFMDETMATVEPILEGLRAFIAEGREGDAQDETD